MLCRLLADMRSGFLKACVLNTAKRCWVRSEARQTDLTSSESSRMQAAVCEDQIQTIHRHLVETWKCITICCYMHNKRINPRLSHFQSKRPSRQHARHGRWSMRSPGARWIQHLPTSWYGRPVWRWSAARAAATPATCAVTRPASTTAPLR